MMKHGLLMPALLCWAATAVFAVQGSPGSPEELSLQELEGVEGGDLYLAVDRNRQMMTVTQVTPGQYSSAQSYSVKVTTSVVRNKDVSLQTQKGDMTNPNRLVATSATTKTRDELYQLPVQYPSGTYKVSPSPTTLPNISGPVIQTSASQRVPVVTAGGSLFGSVMDFGYYIHYANPRSTTNTLGCIGVQSLAAMNRVAETLKTDTASYPNPSLAKQTVTVSSYTNNTPPAASAFTPAGSPPTPSPAAASSSSSSSGSGSGSNSGSSSSSSSSGSRSPSPSTGTPAPVAKAPVAPTPPPAPAPATVSVPAVKAPIVTKTVKMKDL